MTLEQVGEMWYNTGVNYIKSSGALERRRYPFSTRVRGTDTMSHSIPNPRTRKTCTKCEKSKPLSEFAHAKQGAFGRYSICKECKREAKRLWHAANKANQNEKVRLYQEQNRGDLVAKKRIKYRENRPQMIEAARNRYWSDPAKAREIVKRSIKPDKHRAHTAVANAVKKGVFPPAWTMVCEGCQESQAAHWHHYRGYAAEFKLHVVALCTDCHGKAHWADYD